MIFPIGLQYGVTNEGPITLFVSGSDALGRIDKEPASPESIQGEFAEFHLCSLSYLPDTINERCHLIFEGHKFRAETIRRQNNASEKERRVVIMNLHYQFFST